MKARYSVGEFDIEIEAPDLQTLIKEVTNLRNAIAYEICGKCKDPNTIVNWRNVDSNDFFELKCTNRSCGAVLQLGTHKEDKTLYKKKMKTNSRGKAEKDGDKAVYLPDNGWLKYDKESGQMK